MSPFSEEKVKVFYSKELCGLPVDILFYFNPSTIGSVDSNDFFFQWKQSKVSWVNGMLSLVFNLRCFCGIESIYVTLTLRNITGYRL